MGLEKENSKKTATIFNIQRFSVHDGPGIRTTVFFKGCNLRCLWCQNPEGLTVKKQLGLARNKCTRCGVCSVVCPQKAVTLNEKHEPVIDRKKCTVCGECVKTCRPGARTVYGKEMDVDEVFQEVNKDAVFYKNKGGVTASGGEPLLQVDFLEELWKKCKQEGLHTCIETAGFVPSEAIERIVPLTDYVLFDLKEMNSDKHKELCGQPNERIIENIKIAAAGNKEMMVRIPVIPGMNDDEENIRSTARFVKSLRSDISIELLPYHRMGVGKYEALDQPYATADLEPKKEKEVTYLQEAVEEEGVHCIMGGHALKQVKSRKADPNPSSSEPYCNDCN